MKLDKKKFSRNYRNHIIWLKKKSIRNQFFFCTTDLFKLLCLLVEKYNKSSKDNDFKRQ